jgi:hypothetical protein
MFEAIVEHVTKVKSDSPSTSKARDLAGFQIVGGYSNLHHSQGLHIEGPFRFTKTGFSAYWIPRLLALKNCINRLDVVR